MTAFFRAKRFQGTKLAFKQREGHEVSFPQRQTHRDDFNRSGEMNKADGLTRTSSDVISIDLL